MNRLGFSASVRIDVPRVDGVVKHDHPRRNRASERKRSLAWRNRNLRRARRISRDWRANNPASYLLSNAKIRARKYRVPFDLQLSDIVIPKRCPILGIRLKVGLRRCADGSPTLDRFDPKKGYVRGNVTVISYRANVIKSYGTAKDHARIAKWMEARR